MTAGIGKMAARLSMTQPSTRLSSWANIQDLRCRIDAVETDALYQDDLVDQLKHMNKGKTDTISKLFGAMGSVGGVKYQVQAAKDRDEAASIP